MNRITTIVAALFLLSGTGCLGLSKYTDKEREAMENEARAKEASAKAGSLESRLAASEARAAAAEQKLAAAEAKVKEATDWAAGSEAKAQALQTQLEQAKKELASVTESRDALQVQTAALVEKSSEYEKLAGSLQSQIQAGQIEISQLKDKMTVKLKDRILFASGSAKLNPEGRKALDAVAGAFRDLQGKNVVVAGYTDDIRVSKGLPFKDNWDLSSARAIAVVRYLVAKGVPPEMLAAAGYAEFRPLAPNDSAANRSLNRRIEIALTAADPASAPVVDAR